MGWKYEIEVWTNIGGEWEYRQVYAGSDRQEFKRTLKRHRADGGAVRVTYRD